MTSRQARRLRREAERKAAKLAYQAERAFQAEVAASEPDFPNPVSPQPRAAQLDQPAVLSDAKTQRNRANAQFSTGPTTPEGKLASSRNSLKHGLASGRLLIPGEDAAAFAAFHAALEAEHQPATPTEELLLKEMAESAWLMQRATNLQNTCFTSEGVDEKRLALYLRYFSTYERAFHKALNALLKLKKERQRESRGFVSQSGPNVRQYPGFVSQNQPAPEPRLDEAAFSQRAEDSSNGFVSQNRHTFATPTPKSMAQAA